LPAFAMGCGAEAGAPAHVCAVRITCWVRAYRTSQLVSGRQCNTCVGVCVTWPRTGVATQMQVVDIPISRAHYRHVLFPHGVGGQTVIVRSGHTYSNARVPGLMIKLPTPRADCWDIFMSTAVMSHWWGIWEMAYTVHCVHTCKHAHWLLFMFAHVVQPALTCFLILLPAQLLLIHTIMHACNAGPGHLPSAAAASSGGRGALPAFEAGLGAEAGASGKVGKGRM
jgi:hypothetical protein